LTAVDFCERKILFSLSVEKKKFDMYPSIWSIFSTTGSYREYDNRQGETCLEDEKVTIKCDSAQGQCCWFLN
jgi:hypothetical protein